ncbi:zinc-binding dehydrogenase [Caldalkalibacillus salinus]|uniref:zinc-binding dehydrogenase n=1 Tax=Caldalkalibacillus salinus TaxID=2803787 RepID=UPI001920CAE1|nr:zinc-binding dehydrogenase [Caldalkalibacillus salinus]
MKAYVHEGEKGIVGAKLTDVDEPSPRVGEVKIHVKVAGLNHRDLFVLDKHPEHDPPLVLGSDGAGIVETVGEGVTDFSPGDEVLINPSLGWYEKSDAPPEGFQILGFPDNGTFAEKVIVSQEQVEPKPQHLSWEEAGVLSLAALTAYRALFTQASVKPSQTILLPGVGSGAVTFLLMYAKAIGARVIVTSRSETKRQKALALGADVAIDSAQEDWSEALRGEKVDVAVETVGAATFSKTLGQLRQGGTLVTFGASAGDEVSLNIRQFFYGQYRLLGTTMGSRDEYREMLHFIRRYNIKPLVDRVYPLSDAEQAFKRLEEAEQFGKIALRIDEEKSI